MKLKKKKKTTLNTLSTEITKLQTHQNPSNNKIYVI